MYKIYFKWKEKDVELRARELDMTHPYFVSIKDMVFENGQSLIIDPSQDEVRRSFGDSHHVMIPFQTVTLIEELKEDPAAEKRVMPFQVVDDESKT